MKYIDADKIRAEIERLFGEYKSKFLQYGDSYHLGLYDGLSMATKVLDTPEEPVSDCHDLEEEIRKYMSNDDNNPFDWDWRDKRDYARHFAEWQKAKMMEGTVECDAEICKLVDRVWVTPTDEKKFHQDVYDNFKAGDKVRIIIVKEDNNGH